MAQICNCYLVFDAVNQGSLTHVWSTGSVDNWIMKGVSTKPVPAHKFKGKGTSEITRGLQSNKQLYYAGAASFLKLGKPYNCTYEVKDVTAPLPLSVILHKSGNEVVKLQKFGLDGVDCIACVPPAVSTFNVKTMELSLFESAANSSGASLRV